MDITSLKCYPYRNPAPTPASGSFPLPNALHEIQLWLKQILVPLKSGGTVAPTVEELALCP